MVTNSPCPVPVMLAQGPFLLTQAAPGPVAVDCTLLGLAPGQVAAPVAHARNRTPGAQPTAVNLIITPDAFNPHTTWALSAVPAPEVGGDIEVMVYFFYGAPAGVELG